MNAKMLSMVCGVLLLAGLSFAPGARADDRDQSCEFTFSQSIQIPGNIVLPAGTYWFTMVDSGASRPVVEISSADGLHHFAALITIETDRFEATDLPQLKFANVSANEPAVLINWFYPGRLAGHEFVYSRPLESQISESEQFTVMATPVPLTYHDWSVGIAS